MSKFFVGFLSSAQLTALHNAGHAVESFVLSEPAKLVATLAATSIGAIVKADVAALKDSTLSGAQKFDKVLATTLPLVVSYASNPGAIITDVEGIARALVQDAYNDLVGAVKAVVAPSAATANRASSADPASPTYTGLAA